MKPKLRLVMRSIKTVVVLVLLLGLVGLVSAEVILTNGEEIDATAYLEGGLVYLTLSNGMMQAYDPDDVDLEASGLVPIIVQRSGHSSPSNQKPTMATLGGPRLKERSLAKDDTLISITDADVSHVVPKRSQTDAGESLKAPELVVSRIRKQRSGNLFKISGLISNASAKVVESIIVRASAIDHDGQGCGQRAADVPGQLEPGQDVRFTIELAVKREVKDLRIEAHGKEIRTSAEDS